MAVNCVGTDQAAACAKREHLRAIYRGRTSGAIAPAISEKAAQFSRPQRLATLGLLRKQLLLAVLGSHNEQPAIGDHRRRVANAYVTAQPNTLWPGAWPGLEQTGLTADAITVGASPLRPIASLQAKGSGNEQCDKNVFPHDLFERQKNYRLRLAKATSEVTKLTRNCSVEFE